jgi:hypothetical protein
LSKQSSLELNNGVNQLSHYWPSDFKHFVCIFPEGKIIVSITSSATNSGRKAVIWLTKVSFFYAKNHI